MSEGNADALKIEGLRYPVSAKLNITYNSVEDRLVVLVQRLKKGPARVLLTRHMTIVMLEQLLARLPEMSGFNKSAPQHWQDILQITHHHAMQSRAATEKQNKAAAAAAGDEAERAAALAKAPTYLATGMTLGRRELRLLMALRGFLLPDSMTQQSPTHEPIMVIPLELEHVHQIIEVLMIRASEGHWRLPHELPWRKADPLDNDSPLN